MSDFNPLDNAKIPVHRSSFDLSQKRLFTAKVGELLPVYWQIAIPGNKYRIRSDWFTRTVPVNTAAYTRIKEYYDFFAVPLRLLSRQLPQAFTQMSDYQTSAASKSQNTTQLQHVPYASLGQISTLISQTVLSNYVDDAGFGFGYGSCKLLNMLDYGAHLGSANPSLNTICTQYLDQVPEVLSSNPLVYGTSVMVNTLPLQAYQKIYYDFFSNSQWETHRAYAYNVDYWQDDNELSIPKEMLQIRYANYPKDYFMGVLPNSQYGSVAVLPSALSSFDSSSVLSVGSGNSYPSLATTAPDALAVNLRYSASVSRDLRLNSDLSALSIRATEYLQRWKEVVQFSSKDYADQIEAQFGIKAPEYMGNHCHYIGGWSNVININEVVNTNLDASDSQASIAGKGVGSYSGHELSYSVGAEHCVIMCIYHSVPLLDWSLSGQSPQLTVTSITDFPQPAFDQLGMQPVSTLNLFNYNKGTITNPSGSVVGNIGYNLRYWPWKTNIDRVSGNFMPVGTLKSWAAPLDGKRVHNGVLPTFTYQSFKVIPGQLNSIFDVQVTTEQGHYGVAHDQLLCNVNFQVYAVQNLDRNGLPY